MRPGDTAFLVAAILLVLLRGVTKPMALWQEHNTAGTMAVGLIACSIMIVLVLVLSVPERKS